MSIFRSGSSTGQSPNCIEALKGFPPGPNRELLVRPDQLEETPPTHMLKYSDEKGREYVRDFYRVRFWLEKNLSGALIKVVCFGCGSCYVDQWTIAHYGEQQRVRPMVDGGIVASTGRPDRACTCFAGRAYQHSLPRASRLDQERAERESLDREIAVIVHHGETGSHVGLEDNPFWVKLQASMEARAKAIQAD